MLILITSEKDMALEKEQLPHFFETGLPLLHVRKPGITAGELRDWLCFFDEEHLRKMVLHQHHQLAEDFPVKGIHIKEDLRLNLYDTEGYIKKFRSKGCSISASFHDPQKLRNESTHFDYVFLSPVFASLSKQGYSGQYFRVQHLSGRIIALGGIKKDNIIEAEALGYQGVAVLGAVWLAENPKLEMQEIFKAYRDVYC